MKADLLRCKFTVDDSQEFDGHFVGLTNAGAPHIAADEKTVLNVSKYLLASGDVVARPPRREDGLFDMSSYCMSVTEIYATPKQAAYLINRLIKRA